MIKVLLIIALFTFKVSCDDINFKSCGVNKVCVPRYLCKDGQVNKDGSGIIVPRIVGDFCESWQECCSIDDTETETISPPVCGRRGELSFQLKGGMHEAEFGEFPWMVAILVNKTTYHSGGSILHPKVVLTTAYRLRNNRARDFTVRAGEWDRNDASEPLPHQDRQLREIIIHKDFTPPSIENNVALLILESAFNLSPHIIPICLPPVTYNAEEANCFVTGWGKTEYTGESYSSILKKVGLKLVSRTTCEINLQKATSNPTFKLYTSYICAGGKAGEDACTGDGGSPLVCPLSNDKTRFFQVGVVSAGVGCGRKEVPGLYVNTSYVLPWIENQFRVRNFNLTYLS